MRDALSLLDQAIAHGAGSAPGSGSPRTRCARCWALPTGAASSIFSKLVMRGQMAEALGILKDLYDLGADPAEVLVGLAEFVHLVTRLKLVPEAAQDASLTPEERTRGSGFRQELSMPVLTRAWQLLLKGLREVKDSPRPLAAADMVLVRLALCRRSADA